MKILATLCKTLQKEIARRRFLRYAHNELHHTAREACTPERYQAGEIDIRRLVKFRYGRVASGRNLQDQKVLLVADVERLYINTADVARERLTFGKGGAA